MTFEKIKDKIVTLSLVCGMEGWKELLLHLGVVLALDIGLLFVFLPFPFELMFFFP
jgi:hypothetical protein